MRNSFVHLLSNSLKEHKIKKPVCVLTGDLGYSVLEPLMLDLGDRFINVGVAEANMTSIAAALAHDGFKVFTYSIMPFATFRCLEQIRNDICYHNLDVTVVGIGAGYGYGTLGPTHHSTEDLAALWALPNIHVYAPSDTQELKFVFDEILESETPKYLRLGKGGEGALKADLATSPYQHVYEYSAGTDLTIICNGPITKEALNAASGSAKSIQFLTVPKVKPFPEEELIKKIKNKKILVVDELNPYGGFADHVCKVLVTNNFKFDSLQTISAHDAFAKIPGLMDFQRHQAGISAEHITKKISQMMNA